eukprot:12881405-Ditylum_brightwellii.AAC.1
MEGLATEYIEGSNNLNEQKALLSDDSDQGAATTAAHTEKIPKLLLASNRIKREQSTIMENTDVCSKQYRSASS